MSTKAKTLTRKTARTGLTAAHHARLDAAGLKPLAGGGERSPAPNGLGRQGAHVVEMQRRRLLRAFVELVSEQGLRGAGIGPMCKRAGVSRRTFYEVFADHDACVLAALEEALWRICKCVLPAYEGERKWSARIRAGLLILLECFDAEPGLARLCVIETLRAAPEVSARRKQVLDTLASAVDEGRRESKRGDALPPLTAQGVVGGALSVIHARLLEEPHAPLIELAGPLMAMIVHPYLGPAAARRELDRPAPRRPNTIAHGPGDPFKDLPIRFTYRTALVLATIAAEGGRGCYPSNRHIADTAGIADDGQTSRLLRRLQGVGLIENHGVGHAKGEANAWALTPRGRAVQEAIGGRQ
jgi:AcrR family transcriptional regulator